LRDFFFVHADERPRHRQPGNLIDRGQVLERLRSDLSNDLSGHESASFLLRRPRQDRVAVKVDENDTAGGIGRCLEATNQPRTWKRETSR
jgi:hypothetical protein